MITLTENALKKLQTVQASKPEFSGKPFRVFVQAGGCSGYNYGFTFDDKRPDDRVFSQNGGVDVIVDPQSDKLISDSIVDWIEDFTGAGFQVRNPKATGTCGCGVSFTVDEQKKKD